jgi:predicted dehydrogenase
MNRRQFLLETGTTATAVLAGGLLTARATESALTEIKKGPVTRIAIIGFQHPHIWSVVAAIKARSDVKIVAACEEDSAMRANLIASGKIHITHTDYHQLLAAPDIDAVVVGEWFGKRGRVIIDSLKSGRPVLSDKPMCTTLADYEEIARLTQAKNLAVNLMLDLRDSGVFIKMRELVRSGAIGDVREISVGAEHPLSLKTRPAWFHEAGKQGGTINDIGIHGFDAIPWITGLGFRRIVAARVWKTSGVPAESYFLNAGQAMLEMDNGAGMNGSFSYVSPTSLGYSSPMYWRLTIWGGDGAIEGGINSAAVMLYKEGETAGRAVPPAPTLHGGFLDSFLRQIRGQTGAGLTTADVLHATRVALCTQAAADKKTFDVAL